MSDVDALKIAFREGNPVTPREIRRLRRAQRADRTRREALSPVRILMNVLLIPLIAAVLTVSIYLRASPFERQDALRHLVALTGCSAAEKVGLVRAREGAPGYHLRNDLDGDGIACNEGVRRVETVPAGAGSGRHIPVRGAKFLRP